MISGPDTQQCEQTRVASGIKFSRYIGDEQNLRKGKTERRCNPSVAYRVIFRTCCCIKVAAQIFGKISGTRCGKKQALRENAT